MARYLGPALRKSRRVGRDLSLKSGAKPITDKCKLEQKPGMAVNTRRGRPSNYANQLEMQQVMRFTYGMMKKQFKDCFNKAEKQKGSTADNLIIILESRLDNIVYRMNFASTRAQARQLVSHGHVTVNGKLLDIPSYQVSPGDVVSIREKSQSLLIIKAAREQSDHKQDCDWVKTNESDLSGVLESLPDPTKFYAQYQVNLVVELYSK
ncbi:MAG: 30S ribosomal protein S4 [Legionellales bacterium]|nr:30S ribosomal protein S4 [Legionellales bacterium]